MTTQLNTTLLASINFFYPVTSSISDQLANNTVYITCQHTGTIFKCVRPEIETCMSVWCWFELSQTKLRCKLAHLFSLHSIQLGFSVVEVHSFFICSTVKTLPMLQGKFSLMFMREKWRQLAVEVASYLIEVNFLSCCVCVCEFSLKQGNNF